MRQWEPLRLSDDVRRVGECWRACFDDDWLYRSMARADWLAFIAFAWMCLAFGFVIGSSL